MPMAMVTVSVVSGSGARWQWAARFHRPVMSHTLGTRLTHLRYISLSRKRLKSHAFTPRLKFHFFCRRR